MIRVDIPDKNTFVDFPDGTPPEIIEKTIRENFYSKRKGPFSQFQRVGDIYKQEVESGTRAMKEFADKPTGRTAISGAMGGLQYLASPLTAVARGIIGEPVQETAEAIGVPKEVNVPVASKALGPMPLTKMIGDVAEQGAYMLPYGQMVKQAIKGGSVIQEAQEAQRLGAAATKQAGKATSKTKPPLEYVTEPTTKLSEELKGNISVWRTGSTEGKEQTGIWYYLKEPQPQREKMRGWENTFKEHSISPQNILKVPESEITFKSDPATDLLIKWFPEYKGKTGPMPIQEIDSIVAKEARARGYDAVQYGDGEKASIQYLGKLLSKPVVEETLQKQVANAAEEILTKVPPDEKKRIGQQIIELVHSDQIKWNELPRILEKNGITAEEFAQRLKDTWSTAGRTLNRLSIVAKQVQKTLKDNPEAQKFFNDFIKELPPPSTTDRIMNAFTNLERTRRGFLVTQLATAMRNTLSQAGRASIGMIDDAFQGVIRGTVGGEGNPLKQAGEGLDTFIALWNRVSPSGRDRLRNILNSEQATLAKTKMLSTSVHEVNLGSKVASYLNTFNTAQEHFFRKLAFESKLTQLLERNGMNIKNIDPNKIPKGMLEEAAEYSLEMTFAAMPKSQFGKKFVKDIAGNPIATALINPFPRFAFGNALPYLINFSPISFMKAMNPKVVAQLANGNPEEFAKNASRATLGMMQLGLAQWLRNSEHRGEKWHEVKIGDKYYDVRAYAPLLSPYMLVAEAMSHPEKLKTADWAQAAIGLNRVAGTGLVLTDIIRGKDVQSATKLFSQMAGEYLGSFSVPARTFQDIYSGIKPETSTIRDVRENPLTGPIRKNVPVVSETLPEAVSPIKKEPPRPESPILRQLTGLSRKTKTWMEQEVDRLGIESFRIAPRTGIPKADRELSKYMGPAIEQIAPQVLGNPNYQKLGEPEKRLILTKLFAKARLLAQKKLMQENPELAKQVKIEGLQHDIKELLSNRKIIE